MMPVCRLIAARGREEEADANYDTIWRWSRVSDQDVKTSKRSQRSTDGCSAWWSMNRNGRSYWRSR